MLVPKLVSLVDCFTETDARIAIVTETWFKNRDELERLAEDLSLGEGIGMLHKNRDPNQNGVSYRGVAVLWRESFCSFKTINCKNVENYEVLACVGSIRGQARKLVVVACYVPPTYDKRRGEGALAHIADVISEIKRHFSDPYIILSGDFGETLLEFADMKEIKVGYKKIDRFFTNFSRTVTESGTLAPLETEEDERRSDHKVAFLNAC